MHKWLIVCSMALLVAGCDSMTHEETITAIKQCEDAGREAIVYRRVLLDGAVVRVDCDIKRQPGN